MSEPENPYAFAFEGETSIQNGMTTRDYFAGQALAGYCANAKVIETVEQISKALKGTEKVMDPMALLSKMTFDTADAMLAEREKGQ